MKKHEKVLLALVLLFGVGLRLFGLNIHSLWFDEGCTIANSSYATLPDLWNNVIAMPGGSERYQPLNIILLWCWRQVFGSSEFVLRLFPAFFGILGLPLMYWCSRQWFEERKASLWAVVLFAASSFGVYYAQEIRPYSLLILLTVCFLAAYRRTHKHSCVATSLLLALASMLYFVGSIFSALFIVSLAFADLVFYRDIRAWIARWWSTMLVCLPIALFYLSSRDVAGGTVGAKIPDLQQAVWQNAAFSIYGVLAGTTFGPSIEQLREGSAVSLRNSLVPVAILGVCCMALIVGFASYAIARLKRRADQGQDFVVLLVAAVMMLGIQMVFALAVNFNWQPRHTYWLLPLLVLLLSGAASTGRWLKAGCSLLVCLNLFSISQYWFNPIHRKDDYRRVCNLLLERNDGIPIIAVDREEVYAFYGLPVLSVPSETDLKQLFKSYFNERSAVYLVVNRPYYGVYVQSKEKLDGILPDGVCVADENRDIKGFALFKLENHKSNRAPLR